MHKNATKCNETLSKWCKNKHGVSKIIDTLETYQSSSLPAETTSCRWELRRPVPVGTTDGMGVADLDLSFQWGVAKKMFGFIELMD
jgi:hypothetical protein